MVQVTLCQYPELSGGEVNLAFRLTDGKRVRLQYVSEMMVPVKALGAFAQGGSLKARVKKYDRSVKEAIDSLVPVIHEAYSVLLMAGRNLNDDALKVEVERVLLRRKEAEAAAALRSESLVRRYRRYVEECRTEGVVGDKQLQRMDILGRKLERFLLVNGCPEVAAVDFTAEMLVEFEKFCYDEYLFAANPIYKKVYSEDSWREWPSKRLKSSTMSPMMGRFLIFFDDLASFGEIPESPSVRYEDLVAPRPMRLEEMFGSPVTLSREEFQTILKTPVPERLAQTRNAFVLHCCLGCKEIDFFSLTMDNVSVYRGIPYVHYVPEGRKKGIRRGRRQDYKPVPEVRVPLVRVAFDIVMRTKLEFSFSSDRAYSNQVPQLLRHCGIDKPVQLFDPNNHEVVDVPLCDAPLIRLAQRTHLELVNALEGKKGVTSRDYPGMDAIDALSRRSLQEYRLLLNRAFKQQNFSTDEDFNIIKGEPFVEDEPSVYVEEKPLDEYSEKGRPYLLWSFSSLPSGEGKLEDRVSLRQLPAMERKRGVKVYGSQFDEYVAGLPEKHRMGIDQGILLLKEFAELPELLVSSHGGGLYSLRTSFHGYEYCTFFYWGEDEMVILYASFTKMVLKEQLLATIASKVRKLVSVFLTDRAAAESYDGRLEERFGFDGSPECAAAVDAALVEYTSQILRHARLDADLSQEELAARIGTRYRNLSPAEIGPWILRQKNLCRILEALGLVAVIVRPGK